MGDGPDGLFVPQARQQFPKRDVEDAAQGQRRNLHPRLAQRPRRQFRVARLRRRGRFRGDLRQDVGPTHQGTNTNNTNRLHKIPS